MKLDSNMITIYSFVVFNTHFTLLFNSQKERSNGTGIMQFPILYLWLCSCVCTIGTEIRYTQMRTLYMAQTNTHTFINLQPNTLSQAAV